MFEISGEGIEGSFQIWLARERLGVNRKGGFCSNNAVRWTSALQLNSAGKQILNFSQTLFGSGSAFGAP